jgi:hypothetical protein
LRVGSLALGGLALPGLLKANTTGRNVATGKSVVLLFLQGGPSQLEFFDPKMEAPEEFRSITGEVPTKIPGITFGGGFEKLAERADRLAIVRSFGSGNADHQNYLSVAGGSSPLKASMGPIYSRIVGANRRDTGMPTNSIITPEAVDPKLKLGSNFETQSMASLKSSGMLGADFTPFDPSGGGDLKKNLELRLPQDRFDERRSLLGQLDGFQRTLESTKTFDNLNTYQRQAYEVIQKGIVEAFDLRKELPETIAKYDTSGIFKQEDLQKFFDMKRVSNLLGKQMLMARRLVEAGCGFVTVCDAGWDMHANNNSPKNMTGMMPMTKQVDHAVAAFLDDLKERGLSEKVLLIVSGEMGRTPRINKGGGRDHYAELTPQLRAGGGLKMGQVIGRTDKTAAKATTQRYTPQNLLATVMNVMFDTGEVRLMPDLSNELVTTITTGKPIPELMQA